VCQIWRTGPRAGRRRCHGDRLLTDVWERATAPIGLGRSMRPQGSVGELRRIQNNALEPAPINENWFAAAALEVPAPSCRLRDGGADRGSPRG
jgi:hypothetical protein